MVDSDDSDVSRYLKLFLRLQKLEGSKKRFEIEHVYIGVYKGRIRKGKNTLRIFHPILAHVLKNISSSAKVHYSYKKKSV